MCGGADDGGLEQVKIDQVKSEAFELIHQGVTEAAEMIVQQFLADRLGVELDSVNIDSDFSDFGYVGAAAKMLIADMSVEFEMTINEEVNSPRGVVDVLATAYEKAKVQDAPHSGFMGRFSDLVLKNFEDKFFSD